MINLPIILEDGCPAPNSAAVLVLRPGLSYVSVGDEIQFTAVLDDLEGEELVSSDMVFASSDSAIVSVNSSTGLAEAVAEGYAIISVTHNGQTAYARVFVGAAAEVET